MSTRANWLDQSLDIAGSLTQNASKSLSDEPSFLGQAISGQTGATASIASVSSGIVTITGLTGMTAASVGRFITISGAATGANNGTFLVTEYVSATSVRYSNAGGVAPDTNNPSISWAERAPYSLEDDVNFTRTDRAAIKGVAFSAAIPTYERPTAVGTSVPANLSNIASKTLDAHAKAFTIRYLARSVASGTGAFTIYDVTNLKHATAVDRTGVPINDGADAGAHDATYVRIIDPSTGNELEVLAGGDEGKRIFGRTRLGTAVAASGTITTVTGAELVDGQTFVLNDGVNPAVTFEFDDNASVVQTATLRAISFTGGDTADTVRDTIITAVNGAPTLSITASNGGAATVDLDNDNVGTHGNVAVTETVADVDFIVSGMSGGTGSASPDSVEIELRAVTLGANLSTSVAYTWEAGHPSVVNAEIGYRKRLDQLGDSDFRAIGTVGLITDSDLRRDVEDLRDVIDTGLADESTSLAGLLTNTGNFFPFVNLPDGTPSVVEALNTLNAQIGNRDYSATAIANVSGLADGQALTASIEALALAIASATVVRTIERLTADITAGTAHTLPGGLTYTLDGTDNGRNMWVFWRGALKDPGPAVDFNDYTETSTTQITPYSKIKANDHINYLILA